MNKILSIVIPSYNISKYVDECLPTYVNEELLEKIEILLIDDGSTDDTASKIVPYLKRYPNFFTFFHKDNAGHGSVINYAIHQKCIKTKYFKVIDGDDWVDSSELFKLVHFLENNDYDLIVSDYDEVYPDHIVNRYGADTPFENDILKYRLAIHNVTFKTSIFLDNNIFIREKVFYDDHEYILFPLPFIRSCCYVPGAVYKYRLGNPNQSVSNKSVEKHIADRELIIEDLIEKYNEWSKTIPDSKPFIILRDRLAAMIASYCLIIIRITDDPSLASKIIKKRLSLFSHDKKMMSLIKNKKKYLKIASFFNYCSFIVKRIKKHV